MTYPRKDPFTQALAGAFGEVGKELVREFFMPPAPPPYEKPKPVPNMPLNANVRYAIQCGTDVFMGPFCNRSEAQAWANNYLQPGDAYRVIEMTVPY